MKCPLCAADIRENSKFCSQCGSSLELLNDIESKHAQKFKTSEQWKPSKELTTWQLLKASWCVLNNHRKLLIFPLLSAMSWIFLVMAASAPFLFSEKWPPGIKPHSSTGGLTYFAIILFWILLISVFINSAMTAYAGDILKGNEGNLYKSFSLAVKRIPLMVRWVFFCMTIGVVFSFFEDMLEKAGRFFFGALDTSFRIATCLVIPVMVLENVTVSGALKESSRLMKKTFSKKLIGDAWIGIVFGVLLIPILIPITLIGLVQMSKTLVITISISVTFLIVIMAIDAALENIYNLVIYVYAKSGYKHRAFPSELFATPSARPFQ